MKIFSHNKILTKYGNYLTKIVCQIECKKERNTKGVNGVFVDYTHCILPNKII